MKYKIFDDFLSNEILKKKLTMNFESTSTSSTSSTSSSSKIKKEKKVMSIIRNETSKQTVNLDLYLKKKSAQHYLNIINECIDKNLLGTSYLTHINSDSYHNKIISLQERAEEERLNAERLNAERFNKMEERRLSILSELNQERLVEAELLEKMKKLQERKSNLLTEEEKEKIKEAEKIKSILSDHNEFLKKSKNYSSVPLSNQLLAKTNKILDTDISVLFIEKPMENSDVPKKILFTPIKSSISEKPTHIDITIEEILKANNISFDIANAVHINGNFTEIEKILDASLDSTSGLMIDNAFYNIERKLVNAKEEISIENNVEKSLSMIFNIIINIFAENYIQLMKLKFRENKDFIPITINLCCKDSHEDEVPRITNFVIYRKICYLVSLFLVHYVEKLVLNDENRLFVDKFRTMKKITPDYLKIVTLFSPRDDELLFVSGGLKISNDGFVKPQDMQKKEFSISYGYANKMTLNLPWYSKKSLYMNPAIVHSFKGSPNGIVQIRKTLLFTTLFWLNQRELQKGKKIIVNSECERCCSGKSRYCGCRPWDVTLSNNMKIKTFGNQHICKYTYELPKEKCGIELKYKNEEGLPIFMKFSTVNQMKTYLREKKIDMFREYVF